MIFGYNLISGGLTFRGIISSGNVFIVADPFRTRTETMLKWNPLLFVVFLKGTVCAYTHVYKQVYNAWHCGFKSICIPASQTTRSAWQQRKSKVWLEIDFTNTIGINPKRCLPGNSPNPNHCPWNPYLFLFWLFSCDFKRASSLLPKGICPFYLVRRMLQLFAFLNCLAAQACSVWAVWNVSWRHVTAVLKLMLDFLQQIWIMLKSVLNWRGYVNNSQMGISVLSSREMQAVCGRSKYLAGPSFCH